MPPTVNPGATPGFCHSKGLRFVLTATNLATATRDVSLPTILFFLSMMRIAGGRALQALASLAFVPLSLVYRAFSARTHAWAEGYAPAP